jgi:hypothetical protein
MRRVWFCKSLFVLFSSMERHDIVSFKIADWIRLQIRNSTTFKHTALIMWKEPKFNSTENFFNDKTCSASTKTNYFLWCVLSFECFPTSTSITLDSMVHYDTKKILRHTFVLHKFVFNLWLFCLRCPTV